jgi:hypothetical protein
MYPSIKTVKTLVLLSFCMPEVKQLFTLFISCGLEHSVKSLLMINFFSME